MKQKECFGLLGILIYAKFNITKRLGANGAGKTSTFSILTRATFPSHGTVKICGKNIMENINVGYRLINTRIVMIILSTLVIVHNLMRCH